MVAEAVYLDLSSSDEDENDRHHHRNGSTDSTELSYLSKVCNLHAEEDDVVIIDKPPTSNDKVKRDKPRVIRTVMDDDECCMLDTDPAATDTSDCTPPLDSDELVMTGEKGPVACRDFPHARYLCVHFPFKTTPHASFCTQCHCYVCDSLAPCSLWGDGNSAHDHCHASEESPWKTLRKLAKCRPLSSLATPLPPPPPTLAAAAAQSAQSAQSNRNGMEMGGTTRFVQPSVSQQAHPTSTSPTSQSPGVVGSTTPATLKKHPLVIRLRGKGRGKPSQSPHLGVVRSPKHHHRSRETPAPLGGRIIAEVAPLPTPPAPPYPQFTPYMAPPMSLGAVAPPVNLGVMPPPVNFGVMPPPVSFSLTTDNNNANVASYYAFPAPPLPSSPPPYIPPPPPPPPCVYGLQPQPQPPGVYSSYPSPGAYNPPPHALRLPCGDASVTGFVSAGVHVADAGFVAVGPPQYEDQGGGSHYVAQEYRSPTVAGRYAGVSSYDEGMLAAGPAAEAWAADAVALFDSFASGISVGVGADANQQPTTTSLEKVLEQMAGDDYLWEQFPCW